MFIFSTPVLIRHMWQLKTVVFLHWCLICAVPLNHKLFHYLPKTSICQWLLDITDGIIQVQFTQPLIKVSLPSQVKWKNIERLMKIAMFAAQKWLPLLLFGQPSFHRMVRPGNTKGGSITVPLTSCLTGLKESVLQIKTKNVSYYTPDSKLVK